MRLLIPLVLVLATACSPVFKLSTRQGNIIDSEKLAQVETGMTREQVKYLLGTPLVADEFEPQRWDYVAYLRSGAGKEARHVVSLFFDGDTLKRIEDSNPPSTPAPDANTDPEPAPQAADSVLEIPDADNHSDNDA